MEWVALMVWLLIAMLALPISAAALSGAAGLGLQAPAAVAGLALCALFIIFDGPTWLGWATVAAAVVGIMADVWGADELLSEDFPVSSSAELSAGLLGAQLPLFGVALLTSLCLGVDLVTLN
jgi:hypothetical protein